MTSLFATYPQTAFFMQAEPISWTTLLSCLVAFMAMYTATAVGERLSSSHLYQRSKWWPGGALVVTLGVWNMNFTELLTSHYPFPVTYRLNIFLLSLLPALVAGLVYQYSMARPLTPALWRSTAGLILGLAIMVMHYLGLFSIDTPASLRIAPSSAGLALLLSLVLGIIIIHTLHYTRHLPIIHGVRSRSLIVGLVTAAALCAMHVTTSASVWFIAETALETSPDRSISTPLSVIVSAITALFASGMLASILVDRYLQRRTRREQAFHRQFFDVIESMHDGIVLLDHKARLVMCNHAFETLTGVRYPDLQGLSVLRLSRVLRFPYHRSDVLRCLREHSAWVGSIEVLHRQGHHFPARLSINRMHAEDMAANHFVVTLTDISDQHDTNHKIRYQSYHDPLTGLPNRISLKDRIHSLQLASTDSQHHVMLLLVDIDSFKSINDLHGQASGDRLLQTLSARLKPWARDSADVARLSSNEFALLYGGLSSELSEAEAQARSKTVRILESLNGDYSLAGKRHSCSVSGGYLLYRGLEPGIDELLKRAELALLESKYADDQRPRAFKPSMVAQLNTRLHTERQLQDAIRDDQLRMYIQPQVDTNGRMIGGEALVRWQHPERGLLAPDSFLHLAEETGQIVEIGQWMLLQVCQLLAKWQQHPQRRRWHLSLNVSMREFKRMDFIQHIVKALNDSGAPANRLTLELTESLILGDSWPVIDTITRLRDLGIRLAIDDFGTGYSSLAYLKRLPLDVLKIDATFVRDLIEEPHAAPSAQTIIALARTLQLDVIAEGVETHRQQHRLVELGCHQFQGFLYAPALPLEQLLVFAQSTNEKIPEKCLPYPLPPS